MLLFSGMAKKRNKSVVTVGFVALGCPKNMVDSEKMLAHIGQAGFVITPELDGADVIVIKEMMRLTRIEVFICLPSN